MNRKLMETLLANQITKNLIDKGLYVEAGWLLFQSMTIMSNASEAQRQDMRTCFFAGAQHIFGGVLAALDEDEEPTDDDMRRMSLVHDELGAFADEMRRKLLSRQRGSA